VPAHYKVQVEGKAGLVDIGSVETTHKVLCWDAVSSQSKYVDVVANKTYLDTDSRWMHVDLSDGGRLTVTEDHPITVKTRRGQQNTIPAGQLKAGEDLLTTVKVDNLEVTSVLVANAGEEPCKRAALVVQQGDRHAVLVKSPEAYSSGFIAVGSADARLHRFKPTPAGGFLSLEEERCPVLQRSSSAPALLESVLEKHRRHKDCIAWVKGKASYKKWQARWNANGGRADGDPQTPKVELSKKQFSQAYSRWMHQCQQEPPEST
jgi:hypothetical protein